MSLRLTSVAVALGAGILLSACAVDKDDTKGVVDDSLPPSIPTAQGKADDASKELPLSVESAHPYKNHFTRTWNVDLGVLPICANYARLHFSVLRTEADYDFVTVRPTGGQPVQVFDGNMDDTWTEWFGLHERRVDVRLTTDSSITRHGFVVDRVEWRGGPDRCPLRPIQPCPEGTITVPEVVGECECPTQPRCVSIESFSVEHHISAGRMHSGYRLDGVQASTIGVGPTDGLLATPVGILDVARVDELLHNLAGAGLVTGEDYFVESTELERHHFTIRMGDDEVTYSAPRGAHTAAVTDAIEAFDALFSCEGTGAPLMCNEDLVCTDDACAVPEDGCVCTKIYAPVCGLDGATYGNLCMAGCAGVAVAYEGECGPRWYEVVGGTFVTAHPYANSTSVWKEITLPAEAQSMRLVTTGTFELESGYDFLEVWTWQGGQWVRVARYTGTTGPSASTELSGRYHYLRFVSDSSVTKHGFELRAEWK